MAYKIGTGCSTCHYCYNECPVHAIGFVGSDYAIDPEKCINCGKCAEVCPSSIISNPDIADAAPKHDLITKECDLVVLGGGGSGLVAAVKFAQLTGKKVIVLEKSKKCGGNTNLGHGFMMRYTKWHEKAGLPDGRDESIDQLYERSGKMLDYDLIKRATYSLSDMFDWLCEFGGCEDYFELKTMPGVPGGGAGPFVGSFSMIDFPNRSFENLKCTDHSMGPGWMGTYVVRKMLEEGAKLGVEVLTQHRATKLILDDTGSFAGVVASDPGGETRINAKCCVMATGGFSRSKEIMDKVRPTFYSGYPVHSFTVASCEGDAMKLAGDIGAGIDLDRVKVPMFGPTHHPFHYGVVRIIEQPESVRVGKNGRRFMNEAGRMNMSQMSIMEQLPGHIAWGIMDANTRDIMGQNLINNTNDPETRENYTHWSEQLEEESTYDVAVQKADSLEELAKLMDVDTDSFLDEIAKYNKYCAESKDEDFDKRPDAMQPIVKPPFYGVFLARFNEGAVGGVINDTNLNVLRTDGTPIDGLYICGDCCRGLFTPDDANGKFGEMPWAMASGYMAGNYTAQFLEGK